jgi:hypothetical protein
MKYPYKPPYQGYAPASTDLPFQVLNILQCAFYSNVLRLSYKQSLSFANYKGIVSTPQRRHTVAVPATVRSINQQTPALP